MKVLLALLVLTTTAQADCLQWGTDRYGTRVCMIDDAVNRNWVTPEPHAIPRAGEPLIGTTTTPKCEDGWTLVNVGRLMCARELREPK